MRVWTVRALFVGRRNGLENLNAPNAADKDAVGVRVQDYAYCAAIGAEHGLSDMASQRRRDGRIARADKRIDLQEPKAEIEKYAVPLLCPQCFGIRADFGQCASVAHPALVTR